MIVRAHGIDTLKLSFACRKPLPFQDPDWLNAVKSPDLRVTVRKPPEPGATASEDLISFYYQEGTLKLWGWNPWSIIAEFSVPRLKSESVLNLDLACPTEAYEIINQVALRCSELLFMPDNFDLKKFSRVDTAIDVVVGNDAPFLIHGLRHMSLDGSRKINSDFYETGFLLTARTQEFEAYLKGVEIRDKAKRKERHILEPLYTKLIKDGLVRIEYRYRPKSGAPPDYLHNAAGTFADQLEAAYPNRKIQVVGGILALIMAIDNLEGPGITENMRNMLMADALRLESCGLDYIKARTSQKTMSRKSKIHKEFPVSFKDCAHKIIEFDLGPVIEVLRAA